MGHLHPDGGRKAVAHRAQTPGKPQILRGPHLVLAHFGTDIAVVVLGQGLQSRERVLGFDGLALLFEFQAVDAAPFLDLLPPFSNGGGIGLAPAGFPDLQQVFQHMAHVAHDGDVHADHLARRC